VKQAWRWFGPRDPVSLDDVRQAGATDIVTALHDVPIGTAWTLDGVRERQAVVAARNGSRVPLHWTVVESIPVHDDVKVGAPGNERFVDAFIRSMEALSEAGIRTVCYNFMPVIDWTRTDLAFDLPTGGRALRFDADAFAAFDLFILKRPRAERDYGPEEIDRAERALTALDEPARERLVRNIIAGLPGNMAGSYDLARFRDALARYDEMTPDSFRGHLIAFLQAVLPEAERLSVRLAIHPDDPPFSLLGLPRVVSTDEDLARLFQTLPSPANGLTLCTGSFGVRPDNDLPAMAKRWAERIHFAHLRTTLRETGRSFHEAEHLAGDVDLVPVVECLLEEEDRRRHDGWEEWEIPFRPDHGHQILDDLAKVTNPGYSAIGRLKGLAEIRGIMAALRRRQ
jgi:mannonate dehydratase